MSISAYKTSKGENRYKVRWLQDGKQHYRSFDRKKDAQKWESQMRLAKRGYGVHVDPITVQELWERWRDSHLKPKRAKATLVNYEWIWNKQIKPKLGGVQAQRLCHDPQLLDDWYADRVADGAKPASLRKSMVILQGVMKAGVRWRLVPFNPVQGMEKPSANRERFVTPPSREQVWEIINLLDAPDEKVFVGLMGFAGLRPGEAMALQWSDIREKTILVDKALDSAGVVGATKTGAIRTIPLNDDLRLVLALADRTDSGGAVLPHFRHDRYKGWARTRYARAARKALTVEKVRPYDLRHAYASRLIHEGCVIPMVALAMGHSQQMTLRTYSHLFAEAAASGQG